MQTDRGLHLQPVSKNVDMCQGTHYTPFQHTTFNIHSVFGKPPVVVAVGICILDRAICDKSALVLRDWTNVQARQVRQ